MYAFTDAPFRDYKHAHAPRHQKGSCTQAIENQSSMSEGYLIAPMIPVNSRQQATQLMNIMFVKRAELIKNWVQADQEVVSTQDTDSSSSTGCRAERVKW